MTGVDFSLGTAGVAYGRSDAISAYEVVHMRRIAKVTVGTDLVGIVIVAVVIISASGALFTETASAN